MGLKKYFALLLFLTASNLSADVFPFAVGARHLAWCNPSNTAGLICNATAALVGKDQAILTIIGSTGSGSPTDVATHYTRLSTGTAANSRNGWTGAGAANISGALRNNWDVVWKGGVRGSVDLADDAKYRIGIGIAGGVLAVDFDNTACDSGGTDNNTGYWFCYEQAQQTDWMACSGDGSDWGCTTTGVAGPSAGGRDLFLLRIDARDPAEIKYYVGDVNAASPNITRTTLVPASGSSALAGVYYSARTTAIVSLPIDICLAFMKWTWN
jgi:hypothetical protein